MLMRDSSGMTASDLADKGGHISCTTLLKEAFGKYLSVAYFLLINTW